MWLTPFQFPFLPFSSFYPLFEAVWLPVKSNSEIYWTLKQKFSKHTNSSLRFRVSISRCNTYPSAKVLLFSSISGFQHIIIKSHIYQLLYRKRNYRSAQASPAFEELYVLDYKWIDSLLVGKLIISVVNCRKRNVLFRNSLTLAP